MELLPKKPLLRKVDCIRLFVPDLEAGLAFYRDQLGHHLLWRSAHVVGLQLPDTDTEIVLKDDPGQDVDFLVDDADAAARFFAEAGGKVIVPPFDIQIGRCTVVQDPFGNSLVLLDLSHGLLKTDELGNIIGNLAPGKATE